MFAPVKLLSAQLAEVYSQEKARKLYSESSRRSVVLIAFAESQLAESYTYV
jgi:hypothetical protein